MGVVDRDLWDTSSESGRSQTWRKGWGGPGLVGRPRRSPLGSEALELCWPRRKAGAETGGEGGLRWPHLKAQNRPGRWTRGGQACDWQRLVGRGVRYTPCRCSRWRVPSSLSASPAPHLPLSPTLSALRRHMCCTGHLGPLLPGCLKRWRCVSLASCLTKLEALLNAVWGFLVAWQVGVGWGRKQREPGAGSGLAPVTSTSVPP